MKRSYNPDPKPSARPRKAIRIKDPQALKQAAIVLEVCPVCKDRPGQTVHHIVPRGSPHFGDDVLANLVVLCGHGTAGCHGAVEARRGDARQRLGEHLRHERPDAVSYVTEKLGQEAGEAWLQRHYPTS